MPRGVVDALPPVFENVDTTKPAGTDQASHWRRGSGDWRRWLQAGWGGGGVEVDFTTGPRDLREIEMCTCLVTLSKVTRGYSHISGENKVILIFRETFGLFINNKTQTLSVFHLGHYFTMTYKERR